MSKSEEPNGNPKEKPPTAMERKTFLLNKWQLWILAAGMILGLLGGTLAWAKGVALVPDRINHLEESSASLVTVPTRIKTLEDSQSRVWERLNTDHDILNRIVQSLSDLKEQQGELRQDVKQLRK